jgi:hypothetical protein
MSIQKFQCKICSGEKPPEDSISLEIRICVSCFTSIQVHQRVRERIDFFKLILSEQQILTPIKVKKIHIIEKMNDLFALRRVNILTMSFGEIQGYLEEMQNEPKLKALRFWKGDFIVREYESKASELKHMLSLIKAYQSKINEMNRIKIKFSRFIETLAFDSKFKVLKDALKSSIIKFIKENKSKEYEDLKKFIFEGVANIAEPGLLPNVSLFFFHNYDRIFSTLLTQILPFNKERISFDTPTVNSRTDFGLRMHYRFNAHEINSIKSEINKYQGEIKEKEPYISKFVFINCIWALIPILNDLFAFYYRKLNLKSSVQFIINISGSKQKSAQRFDEVTYWIALREW